MNKLVDRLFEQTDSLYDIPGVCYIDQDGTLIDNGFLMSLRDEKVIEEAARYGDPVELLEAYAE